jgi:integrase
MFSYAYGRRWIDSHPTEKGRVPKLPLDNARTRWLRLGEIDAIREHAPDWMRPIIRFAVMTGMRLGEICALTKASYQVDNNGDAFLITEKTKNGERLAWPLEGWARDYVASKVGDLSFPAGYLFPGPNDGNAYTSIKRHLRPAVENAGLEWGHTKEGVTFHTFRHTMASLALNAGVSEAVVQQMGNWKDRRMMARYAHLADKTLRAGVAKLADLLERDEPSSDRVKEPVPEYKAS